MAQSRDIYRRRRLAALGAVAAAAALAGAAVGAGDDDPKPRAAAGPADTASAKAPKPKRPAELPLGGRTIFPHYRVVAYYGAPQSHELGALGIGSPDAAGRRVRQHAPPHARQTRAPLPPPPPPPPGAHPAPGGGGPSPPPQSE